MKILVWKWYFFIKTMKIHYVLKGIHENPSTRITKKRAQQQKNHPSGWCFRCQILYKSVWNVHTSQAKTSGRGQPGSTTIISKEIIRFNNNNVAKTSKRQMRRTKPRCEAIAWPQLKWLNLKDTPLPPWHCFKKIVLQKCKNKNQQETGQIEKHVLKGRVL